RKTKAAPICTGLPSLRARNDICLQVNMQLKAYMRADRPALPSNEHDIWSTTMQTIGYAAYSPDTPLAPYNFPRRALRSDDVAMEILYCGVCHSDLPTARNDWGGTEYPVVPGHEVVGRVIDVGAAVEKFR